MDIILTQKRCSKCGEWKDKSEYIKDPQKKDGLYSSCKACYKITYSTTRDKYKPVRKKYLEENRKVVLDKKRNRYRENRDVELERMQKYHEDNKEKEKEYRIKNRDKLDLASKIWSFLNKDRVNKNTREWRAAHPDKVRIHKNNRRCREKNGGVITNDEWENLLNKYGNKCLCCGRNDVRITIDHVIPISRGGMNTIENAQPLCTSCNSKKHAKTIDYR
jgi:5-methylcytosine-specific restriction endonuclease McrA